MKNDKNVVWHRATVTRQRRESANRHKSVILWFTGLPCSGKSTIAHTLEEKLYQKNHKTFVLDGDNIRHGLSSDLGFSHDDRTENIRRIGELAKLFIEAGVITITAFISPYRSDREIVRGLAPQGDFMEIFCDCPLAVCEKRDVKGLYKKARAGEISEYTGISSPYEKPENPELRIDTDGKTIEESVDLVLELLRKRGILNLS